MQTKSLIVIDFKKAIEKNVGDQTWPLLAMSAQRPASGMSQNGPLIVRPTSLPRPDSAKSGEHGDAETLDQEEYKNYLLDVLHSGASKNARFQQLRAYYQILDRALKLEKKSSSMDIHKLRSEDVVDFETWRILRHKEKAR